jgi:hypothetical protein
MFAHCNSPCRIVVPPRERTKSVRKMYRKYGTVKKLKYWKDGRHHSKKYKTTRHDTKYWYNTIQYNSCSALSFSVLLISFYSILFYFILFCSVLFCSVLFCSVLFCSVLFCSVLFWSVLRRVMLLLPNNDWLSNCLDDESSQVKSSQVKSSHIDKWIIFYCSSLYLPNCHFHTLIIILCQHCTQS